MINFKRLKFKLFITFMIYYELFILYINKLLDFISNYIDI
jgi:hypothetical protein